MEDLKYYSVVVIIQVIEPPAIIAGIKRTHRVGKSHQIIIPNLRASEASNIADFIANEADRHKAITLA